MDDGPSGPQWVQVPMTATPSYFVVNSATFVASAGDEYEILRCDVVNGSCLGIIDTIYRRARVTADEFELRSHQLEALVAQSDPAWAPRRMTRPESKPALRTVFGDRLRWILAIRGVPDALESPQPLPWYRWFSDYALDVFAPSGRAGASLRLPRRINLNVTPALHGGRIAFAVRASVSSSRIAPPVSAFSGITRSVRCYRPRIRRS